ncbi:MAG: hypothetical protein U5N10_03890 [Gemmobacter sp.]|nr:hypothetical protein [Gemmobacter sp.]
MVWRPTGLMIATIYIAPEAAAAFATLIAARAEGRPVSQILGRRRFWGRSFRVTHDVLDPRPETEALVAEALTQPFTRLLDLGTGSGAIALSLLADQPEASGLATDLSPPSTWRAQQCRRSGPVGSAELSDRQLV